MPNKNNVVIIRRPKRSGHGGHHGGHWKVAYADFMTAMMAFFLLLWILSVSDDNKLEGIAQFFTPTEMAAGRPGGEGVLQGSALSENQNVLTEPSTEPVVEPAQQEAGNNPWAKLAQDVTNPDEPTPAPLGEALERAGENFLDSVNSQPALSELAGNLLVRQIEGQLVVDIIDLGDEEMFAAGDSGLSEDLRKVLAALAPTIVALPHPIRVTGHADGAEAEGGGDLWQLSSQRADVVRRTLAELGLDPARFSLISGAAQSRPLDPLSPQSPRNRRVTIELGSALD